MRSFSGTLTVLFPFLNVFSLQIVRSVLSIAGPAFHISSKNAISESGMYPSVRISRVPFSSA